MKAYGCFILLFFFFNLTDIAKWWLTVNFCQSSSYILHDSDWTMSNKPQNHVNPKKTLLLLSCCFICRLSDINKAESESSANSWVAVLGVSLGWAPASRVAQGQARCPAAHALNVPVPATSTGRRHLFFWQTSEQEPINYCTVWKRHYTSIIQNNKKATTWQKYGNMRKMRRSERDRERESVFKPWTMERAFDF